MEQKNFNKLLQCNKICKKIGYNNLNIGKKKFQGQFPQNFEIFTKNLSPPWFLKQFYSKF